MSIALKTDEHNRVLLLTISGHSDFEAVQEAFRMLAEAAFNRPDLDVLIDARSCAYVADSRELNRFIQSPDWAQICQAHSVAILVTKPVHYGNANTMARKAAGKDERGNVEPFYEPEKAREWFRSRRGNPAAGEVVMESRQVS